MEMNNVKNENVILHDMLLIFLFKQFLFITLNTDV